MMSSVPSFSYYQKIQDVIIFSYDVLDILNIDQARSIIVDHKLIALKRTLIKNKIDFEGMRSR